MASKSHWKKPCAFLIPRLQGQIRLSSFHAGTSDHLPSTCYGIPEAICRQWKREAKCSVVGKCHHLYYVSYIALYYVCHSSNHKPTNEIETPAFLGGPLASVFGVRPYFAKRIPCEWAAAGVARHSHRPPGT